eukprot:354551-Chlamydomonas_euryale.AAC.14
MCRKRQPVGFFTNGGKREGGADTVRCTRRTAAQRTTAKHVPGRPCAHAASHWLPPPQPLRHMPTGSLPPPSPSAYHVARLWRDMWRARLACFQPCCCAPLLASLPLPVLPPSPSPPSPSDPEAIHSRLLLCWMFPL